MNCEQLFGQEGSMKGQRGGDRGKGKGCGRERSILRTDLCLLCT